MSSPAENVAKLKDAYRQWHETKGGSVKLWLDLMADHVRVRSLAAGAPEARFTSQVNSKDDFRRYFEGLLDDTPKADFWKFHDGKIVEFYELYYTAAMFAAAGR